MAIHVPRPIYGARRPHKTQTTDAPCEAVGLLLAACTKAIDYMCSVAPTVPRQPLLLLDAHSPVPGSLLHVSCRPHLGIAGEEGLVASPSLADWPVRVGPPLVEFDNEQLHNYR